MCLKSYVHLIKVGGCTGSGLHISRNKRILAHYGNIMDQRASK